MSVRMGAEEGQDNVLEHGQALLTTQADRQTVEILREMVRNAG